VLSATVSEPEADNGSWNVSLIAWGHPSDPATFSGYAQHLAAALRQQGRLRREFSVKLLRVTDLLGGALKLGLRTPRLQVSRRWMFSESGSSALARRLQRHIRATGDRGPFLQIGTLVGLDPSYGQHFVLTDMTIAQAHRAARFGFAGFAPRELAQAMRVQQRIFQQAAHIFALSQWARQSIVEDYGISESAVTVVYAGANLEIAGQLGQPRQPRQILFVGFDWQRKGGPLLLDAFALVRREFPDATLRIVGCSPPVHGVAGVYVEGRLDRRDPAQYQRLANCYLRASCFCLPTLFDPFPNAILEAASVGLPTVAIDNGSRREAVLDGQTGLLARQPTAESIAAALIELLRDPQRCAAMGAAARARAQQIFTWDRVVQRIGQVIAAGHSAPAQPAPTAAPLAALAGGSGSGF